MASPLVMHTLSAVTYERTSHKLDSFPDAQRALSQAPPTHVARDHRQILNCDHNEDSFI
jgi:hypothetical protein